MPKKGFFPYTNQFPELGTKAFYFEFPKNFALLLGVSAGPALWRGGPKAAF